MATVNYMNDVSHSSCMLCKEDFNCAERSPVLLGCCHCVCWQCLCTGDISNRAAGTVKCPACQTLSPLDAIVKVMTPECSTCATGSIATVRCIHCEQNMCPVCASCHSAISLLQEHVVVPVEYYNNLPEEFLYPVGICEKHDKRLSLFCKNRTCARLVCPTCFALSHNNHTKTKLEDIYQERKTDLEATFTGLTSLIEESSRYRNSLLEQNQRLDAHHQKLIQGIDESYNGIVEKLSNIRNKLRENITRNIEKQKFERNRQLALCEQSESAMKNHIQYCESASQYAGCTQFVNMAQALMDNSISLRRTVILTDMHIEDVVPPNLETFHQVKRLLDKPVVLFDMSQMRTCAVVTDATIGCISDVIKVALFPAVTTSEKKKMTLQTAIKAPETRMRVAQPETATVPSIVGRLRFRPLVLGDHKVFIGLDGKLLNEGIVIHSNTLGEKVVKRVVFGIYGQPKICQELQLPGVELDRTWLNWKDCSIDETGDLTNIPSTIFQTSLKHLKGVTARSAIPGLTSCYWQIGVHLQVLASAKLDFEALEAGICPRSECDKSTQPANNKHAWCVSLGSCETHNSVCLQMYARSACLGHVPISRYRLASALDVELGFLLDSRKKVLHVLDVQSNKALCCIPGVDVSQPLLPVFGVFSPSMFRVRVRVVSDADLTLGYSLLHLLSELIHLQ